MRYFEKDDQIYTEIDVRKLHPNTSFADSTYLELGYVDYVPVASVAIPPPEGIAQFAVPQVVSRFQGEAILLTDGILDDVENLVLQGDAMMQLAWKRATEFRRQSPMVLQIAGALGWTDAYIDSLFIRGSAIVA